MNVLSTASLEEIFQTQLCILDLTLRPSTVSVYRSTAQRFLAYLRSNFPLVQQPSDLRRNPHLTGWLISLCEQQPPLSNKTRWSYILLLRRLFHDLAANGHAFAPGLIMPHDFPPLPRYLPRALSPQDDQQLQDYLRGCKDIQNQALFLTRLTGMRIGECVHLSQDCLRELGLDAWALHVPIGKLHTERLVPADEQVREVVAGILLLRSQDRDRSAAATKNFLLPRRGQSKSLSQRLCAVLAEAAKQAKCSCHVTPHQLRHTYASEMIRLGVSLPALMSLLGHKDIRMTMRYVSVTQLDLQREFHAARRNAEELHRLPALALPSASIPVGLPGIRQTIKALRHMMEIYRRQLREEKARRQFQRLCRRLLALATEVEKLANPEK
jgi:site-specific recombinase XerD